MDDSLSHSDDSNPNNSAKSNQAIKSLTSQIKEMALKASGAYKHCCTCTAPSRLWVSKAELDADLEWFRWSYQRTGSGSLSGRTWGKEMEARLKGISSGGGTPSSAAGSSERRVVLLVEENEPKEWVAMLGVRECYGREGDVWSEGNEVEG